MKNIKFEYNHTDELKSLIESTYFTKENNGKLSSPIKNRITLDQDNLYYQVLTGLNYTIKLRNRDLIDGSMEFNMVENDDNIELLPSSLYCVKVQDIKEDIEKYSFY